jgi:antitoxin MazE
MRVVKWGDSLAVQLPVALVEALNLKEGDDVDIKVADKRTPAEIDRQGAALAKIRALRRPLPEGWKFDRDEAGTR